MPRPPFSTSLASRLGVLLVVGITLALAACKDDAPPGVRLSYPPQLLEVGAGLVPGFEHSIVLARQPTEHDRFERETGVAWSDWERIVPRRASLQINEPGLGWGFCEEVIIRAYTDDITQAREVFYRDQIRLDEGARLDMIPSEADVLDLLDGPDVTFVVVLRRLRDVSPQSLPVTLTLSFGGFEG